MPYNAVGHLLSTHGAPVGNFARPWGSESYLASGLENSRPLAKYPGSSSRQLCKTFGGESYLAGGVRFRTPLAECPGSFGKQVCNTTIAIESSNKRPISAAAWPGLPDLFAIWPAWLALPGLPGLSGLLACLRLAWSAWSGWSACPAQLAAPPGLHGLWSSYQNSIG